MDLNDVAVDAADKDRIDRLVERTSFNREEAEAIVRFANLDPADRDPDTIRSFVSTSRGPKGSTVEDGLSATECDRIRRNMGKASRPKTVIDAWPNKHPSVIFRHATGRCDHDADTDAVTSPRIQADECREMRVDFQTGDTVEDIRATYNRSANAVVKHVFGRCDHDFEHKRNGRGLSESLCRRMRRAYRENQTATIADIGAAFIIGTSTAHRHLTGKCGHGDAVEPPIKRTGSYSIDKAECDRIRAAFGDGTTSGDLADDFDRDPTAVRKHLFGRCRHGASPHTATQDDVGATLCKTIRQEYRTRGVESVRSVFERLNTPKATFYYHLFGRCDHDHDVDPVDRDG